MDDPNQKVQALMVKCLKRKQNIQPAKGDGFLTTNTTADSESSGDGNTAGAIGS